MKFTTVNIQGNIYTSEVLDRVRRGTDISHQNPIDFGLRPNELVRDEISNAWSLANTHWQIFKQKRQALQATDSGITETRRYWIIPLLNQLGYDVTQSRADIINGKSYAVSHKVSNKAGFPIHIVGSEQSLDKKAETGQRISPHALVQEYINYTDHIYGFVTNGIHFRVLRDATRLSRLSYLEFNLEQMMEEGHYAEFALFFRLLHASRLKDTLEEAKDSILEFYHNEALASGSRIRERLSKAVEQSILSLANGLISHPDNSFLREEIEAEKLEPKTYYLNILRSVYRVLFLLVIEERNLIYKENLTPEEKKLKDIYYKYYSIQRLTYLVNKAIYIDPKKTDLWQSLMMTFRLFEDAKTGKSLGIAALGSGIFSKTAIENLTDTTLDNKTVLEVFKHLVTFENENNQTVRVNYADLDVEEFGSVYEGLLEYEPVFQHGKFLFKHGNERSSSGSHYTPEELVKPLITHSLDYLIADKLKEPNPEQGLLSLSICDVACGSGHILLSAARRVGFELAKLRSNEDQPTPSVLRLAIRDVIKNCIYGVDLNPLAVELCKVALWLEAHEPGQPLNFLDHRVKCGNAIVGLAHREELEKGIADEAFKNLSGDDKDIAKSWRDKNVKERKEREAKALQLKTEHERTTTSSVQEAMQDYLQFATLPETTPEEIEKKAKSYQRFIDGKGFSFLKTMADTQIAQFFIPKTNANKDYLMTDSDFRQILGGYKGWQLQQTAKAKAIAEEKHFFHWFLEFPEVFGKGGFDCILGNPPFLGGQKLSGSFGEAFLESIKYQFAPIGAVDLVTYFFRRTFGIINGYGFLSLISTNTIAQGKARECGLDVITQEGGTINHAVKSTKWPGVAAVEVALVTITKQSWKGKFYLGNKVVKTITPYLDDAETLGNPFPLKQNESKSFQGSIVLGKGFVLEPHEAQALIAKNPKNKDVLFPYLNGDDLNNSPDQSPTRWVINFFDWPEEKAKLYPDCYSIIERLVKPGRLMQNDQGGKEKWWQFLRPRNELYQTIAPLERVLVINNHTRHHVFGVYVDKLVFSHALSILALEKFIHFTTLSTSLVNEWAWQRGSTMGSATLRYTSSEILETFPFPNPKKEIESLLEIIGINYHEHRRMLMLGLQLGLTKTYNLFHSNALTAQSINHKDKQVASLQTHLAKTPETISLEEAVQGIIKLRELHLQMDEAVLEAYGWGIGSAQPIALRHDFYEVDYLPENDRVRYTIHPEARKEVLKRLLELNHKIHAEEVAAGLWDKKNGTDRKKKGENTTKKKKVDKDQTGLFEELVVAEKSLVTIQSSEGAISRYHLLANATNGAYTGEHRQIDIDSNLAKLLLGKQIGELVEFGGKDYQVTEIS